LIENPRNPGFPGFNGFSRAAALLNDDGIYRPAGFGDLFLQAVSVEAFASQRKQQHSAHVRMSAEVAHHAVRVSVGIAAAEADQVNGLAFE
jgi:hypothetical protein